MTLLLYKIIAGCLIFLTTLTTALYPLLKKSVKHIQSVELSEAFASGIFLGMAFFHMLPDAIRAFSHLDHMKTQLAPEIICLGTFLLFLFLERLSAAPKPCHHEHTCHTTSTSSQHHHTAYSIPYILVIILMIHALVEGAALGICVVLSEAIMLSIAIIAHKGSESFALCIAMLKHHLPQQRIIMILLFFACITPLGIGLGAIVDTWTHATYGQWTLASYNAFAAGTFLYMSTLHHIRFH